MVAVGIYWADLSLKQVSSVVKVNQNPAAVLLLWHSTADTKATAVQSRPVRSDRFWRGTEPPQNQVSGVSGKSKKWRKCICVMPCTVMNDLHSSKFASLKLTWVSFSRHWINLCGCSKCHLLFSNMRIDLVSSQRAALQFVSLTGICFPFQRWPPPSASAVVNRLNTRGRLKAELPLGFFNYM